MKRSDLVDIIYSAQAAITNVLSHWEKGDLASAMRELQRVKETDIDPAIVWWETEQ